MPADAASPSDAELVARAQRGHTAAFDQLVIRHGARLYALLYHMTANREDANDLLQEVFAKAYRSLKRFQGKSQFYTWIYSIAVNMALNFLKKRNRRQNTMSLDDLDAGVANDQDFIAATSPRTPVKEVDLKELQKRLNEAMMTLSEDHRAVVTMYDIQGLPHAEISRIMGVSDGTIRSRLFYAHRQLQSYLDEFWKK
ncbi:MAG: sigma-70 family RNA polymerase sigma factor [Verrucomicrobiales bacterium]